MLDIFYGVFHSFDNLTITDEAMSILIFIAGNIANSDELKCSEY